MALCAALKLALLLCGATMFSAEAGAEVNHSIPAFNAATDDRYYIMATEWTGWATTAVIGYRDLFESYATYNTSEGFVFLSNNVDFWSSGVEASFRTSFTLVAGTAPVSFVVRGGSYSIVMAPRGPRPASATAGLALVEVSGLRSNCSCLPDAGGLNVSISPTGAAPGGGRTVWVDYRAAEHRLFVYVTEAGEPRPTEALLNISMPHGMEGNWTTETAPVGFFAAKIGDIIFGVRDWTLNVELPGDQSEIKGSGLVVILSSVLGSAAAIAITTTAVYLYFNSKYRRWKKEQDKLAKIMQDLPGVPTKVEFTDIKKATRNFHVTMKLGNGGFGAVYRCILPASATRTGQAIEVAVKKFTQEVEDRRYDDFLAEVSIINRLRHKNIVPLVGWSYNKGVPVLVYEYMTHGSLDHHLFGRGGHDNQNPSGARICEWNTRYSIVRDIATGLHYVHHEHEPMVLHRDIKAGNIMLDSTFRARLGDFGISCTVAPSRSYVTGIAGTFGYIGPDYAMSGKATRKTDIYAFGILILEVVTGKKYSDVRPDDDHITDWVWRLHKQGMLLQAVDTMLTAGDKQDNGILIDEVRRLLLLGLACTNPNPSNRPSMVEVVQMINKLAPLPEVPQERPAFVWPPEDWPTRNYLCSTTMSDWDSSSTKELALASQDLPPSDSTGKQASA